LHGTLEDPLQEQQQDTGSGGPRRMNESSVRAGLLFLVGVPVCLIAVTGIIYDISYAVTGQYSFTFSREYVGWQTGDGAVIVWIPTYVIGLFLEIFPLIILMRAYLLRSSHKGLNLLKDPEILTIADDAAVTAGIELPPLYVLNDHRPLLDVLGTNKNPFLRVSNTFIDSFRKKPEELKALLLHEYSHILNKDMGLLTLRTNFIHVLGWYLLIGFGYQCYNGYMYAATYSEIPPSEMGTRVLFRIFGNEVSLFLGIVLLYLLVTSIYREREFLADKKTVVMMKDSTHLISGLTRLKMMIPRGLHIEILSDHPSLQKRIDALRRKRAFSVVLFWTALTLAFCTLVISESFTSLALFFLRYNMYVSQRFYESVGIWIYFCIDVVFPIVIFLYLFRIENTLKPLKSLMYSLSKSCLFCGLYTALRVGYYLLVRILNLKGYYFLDIPHLSVNARYFEWAHILWFDILQDKAMVLLRLIRMLDMPLRLKSALELWIIAFLVMVVCLFLGMCISSVRKVKRVASLPRRVRLFLVAVLEILLVLGCVVVQLPQEEKSSAVEEWVKSYYEVYDYKDPLTGAFVKAGSFDFDTQYDIEDNFYGIHILKTLNNLQTLTLEERDQLINWLEFHQGTEGDFYNMFYFFHVSHKASIWDEYYILLSLEDLDAVDAIKREGAVQYALSQYEEDLFVVFCLVEILSVVDAVDQLDVEIPSYFPSLKSIYWSLALEKMDTLEKGNRGVLVPWITACQTEDGGFCEELLTDWHTEPHQSDESLSDMQATFYAVKSLYILNKLDAADREGIIRYVLSCQTKKGGFAKRPNGEPMFEDTYYAVEILDALDALDRLKGPFRVSDILEEIFHELPLVFYICVGALILIDLFLYYRVWK
jgi:prenyltransferase beta subunit/Zn-dependent protease with chaperone function